MHRPFIGVVALITLLGTAGFARADGFLSPGLGVAFGNPSAQGRANFVFDVGWLAREPIGVELDATIAPSFFGSAGPYGENGVTTIMGNVIFAGRESGGRYSAYRRGSSSTRAYVSGGFGLIRETTTAPAVSNNDLGVNLGAGVMAVSRSMVGIRGDVRYFRDLVGRDNGTATSIDFGSFHFWRANLGLLLRF